jgi:hypothetical protein
VSLIFFIVFYFARHCCFGDITGGDLQYLDAFGVGGAFTESLPTSNNLALTAYSIFD